MTLNLFSRPTWVADDDGLRVHLNRAEAVHSAATVLVLELENEKPEASKLVLRQEYDGQISMKAPEAECKGGVYVNWRAPQLDGWHGKDRENRLARWNIRTVHEDRTYRLVARYGFNAENLPEDMAFVCRIGDNDLRIPLRIAGVEPDAHNKENNQLIMAELESSDTIRLSRGLHAVELRAEGAPASFRKPKGRKNKKLCYTAFPMLEELRLEPID